MKVPNLSDEMRASSDNWLKAAVEQYGVPTKGQLDRLASGREHLSIGVQNYLYELMAGKIKRKRGRPEKGGFDLTVEGFLLDGEIKKRSRDLGISEDAVRRQMAAEKNMSEEKLKDDQYALRTLKKRAKRQGFDLSDRDGD